MPLNENHHYPPAVERCVTAIESSFASYESSAAYTPPEAIPARQRVLLVQVISFVLSLSDKLAADLTSGYSDRAMAERSYREGQGET